VEVPTLNDEFGPTTGLVPIQDVFHVLQTLHREYDPTLALTHVEYDISGLEPGSIRQASRLHVEDQSATVVGNCLIGNVGGAIFAFRSVNTTVAKNHVITDAPGINVEGGSRNTKVVGNNISGAAWGIAVIDAHRGFFPGNTIHNTCGGMFFEAAPSHPVDDFEVKGNTVENNTRSCRAAQWGANFSGIGIAVLGARGMELTGNQISGNVPSGPTPVSGGVIVSTNPFFGGSVKPRNNSVTGNLLGHNKPDIYWDKSGSGNSFLGNLCNTSVPSRLCN
jgi:parallel beta-helix repeat protein